MRPTIELWPVVSDVDGVLPAWGFHTAKADAEAQRQVVEAMGRVAFVGRPVQIPMDAVLRACAEQLEASGGRFCFPGWDVSHESYDDRCRAIRDAAQAVVGVNDPDVASFMPVKSVGMLVRYIADLMEVAA